MAQNMKKGQLMMHKITNEWFTSGNKILVRDADNHNEFYWCTFAIGDRKVVLNIESQENASGIDTEEMIPYEEEVKEEELFIVVNSPEKQMIPSEDLATPSVIVNEESSENNSIRVTPVAAEIDAYYAEKVIESNTLKKRNILPNDTMGVTPDRQLENNAATPTRNNTAALMSQEMFTFIRPEKNEMPSKNSILRRVPLAEPVEIVELSDTNDSILDDINKILPIQPEQNSLDFQNQHISEVSLTNTSR